MWERIQETEKSVIFFSLLKGALEGLERNQQSQRTDGSEHDVYMCSASVTCAQLLSCMLSNSHVCSASLICIQHLSHTLSIFYVFSTSHVCSASFMPLQWASSNCTVPTHLLTCTRENVFPTVTCPQRFRDGRWSPWSHKGLPHATGLPLIVGSKV